MTVTFFKMEAITLFLFVGGWENSDVEQALRSAHQAAARDLLERLLPTGLIDRVVLATDDPAWASTMAEPPMIVELDRPGEPFHFGRRLAGLIEKYAARKVLYVGGASAPLMSTARWRQVMHRLVEARRTAITNNVHSCDWIALTNADEVIGLVAGASNDNELAWVLANEGRMAVEGLPPCAATRFDLDTPADLLIARYHYGIGPHLRDCLAALDWRSPQVEGVLRAMGREGSTLALVGRVSSAAWVALERATRCWVRVFAEERGMRASGRQARGEVRSLVSQYLDLVGVEAFFDELAALADGALIDSRVILAAHRVWPAPRDRFNADLGRWELVEEPLLRRFARAAAEVRIPVLLGGHSVVAGGLMALVEVFREQIADSKGNRPAQAAAW
ncbi:MAG: hypothetical protein N2508_00125 [Anaerolineae bacterium]|nr:hypothetical protein [Anaerolineae bacterium]